MFGYGLFFIDYVEFDKKFEVLRWDFDDKVVEGMFLCDCVDCWVIIVFFVVLMLESCCEYDLGLIFN